MKKDKLSEFNEYREKMNKKILDANNHTIKRFFSLDTLTFREGELSVREKEMLGLVASLVLRCDDCIAYHLINCKKEKLTNDEIFEIFSVALTVGGSIIIPHIRRATELMDEIDKAEK